MSTNIKTKQGPCKQNYLKKPMVEISRIYFASTSFKGLFHFNTAQWANKVVICERHLKERIYLKIFSFISRP